jgi:glycosyltransferase involved in cell wall biosynthesis
VRSARQGTAAARNRGIRLTSAPYVVVLQAEDRLEPGFLAAAAGRLDDVEHADFVITGARGFEGFEYLWTPASCTLSEALACGMGHASILFRRRVWDAVGGYDPAASVCLDQEFWIAALAAGFRGELIEEPLVAYRVRADSDYHGALMRGEVARLMAGVYQKHATAAAGRAQGALPRRVGGAPASSRAPANRAGGGADRAGRAGRRRCTAASTAW